MKRELFATVALGVLSIGVLGLSSQAQAAGDRFAGFSAGVDLGWVHVMGQINDVNPNYANVAGYQDVSEADGVLLGGRLGYDWMVDPNWLVGAEANVNMVAAETADCGAAGCANYNNPGSALSYDLESLASLRGRVGYLVDPNAVLYVFGGWALAEVTTHHHDSSEGDGASRNFNGYTVGGGAQYAVSNSTDVRLEVTYYDFSSKTYTDQFVETFGSDPEALTVSLGAVFHFD